jgi:hypothetical protein
MKKDGLSTIVKELENASKMHLRQSKEIEGHIDDMKSPVSRASKNWIAPLCPLESTATSCT